MKKVMIAFAVVAMAACTQAASVAWTITDVYAGSTTKTASGIAFLLNATTALDTSSWKDASSALKWLNSNALGSSGTAYTWSGADGTYSQTAGVDPANLGLVADGTTKYNLYAVVFDTATVTDESNYFVTSANSKGKAIANSSVTTTFGLGSQLTNSQNATNWHAVAAPEPTSGLLLLLGMAGLALRRRRA